MTQMLEKSVLPRIKHVIKLLTCYERILLLNYYGGIHKGRPADREQGRVKQMMTQLLIFTCKRSNFADTGGGGVKKWRNFADVLYGCPLI